MLFLLVLQRGVKVDELATFDIEYLFLNIRESVGEQVEVLITCPDDGLQSSDSY